ncbi:MAG: flavin reductase family protein [Verrucomicrobia bacterium]|nr:MAG: flavin reductase family protein [Verrucomicrobiota bacterium]TAE88341.1 MAG: flavin reductase family protein [Verrucomicrobiota bacterium]TAF26795.1 MAG: flavin reductase family protein [Verrucomicrobiota bacterium]TAF42052.1 MAG: flavin reductase family protein [Verrucomicrobiota bacterium]
MELDLLGAHADRAYPILVGLVTPRPIAWVTTLHENGKVNAAPFSFFNVFGDDPPLVVFAPGDRDDGTPKDSARNVRRSGEFVVNMVDETLAAAMVRSSASHPPDLSETELEGLATAPSSSIATPRIAAAPAALECKVHSIIEVGSNRLVLGIVHRVHVRDECIDPVALRIRQEVYQPIGRMAVPDWYCRSADLFELPRPR